MTADLSAAIASVQPRRTAARLRPYMPMLDERHRAGVTYADLAEILQEQGITIQPETLRRYLAAWRKQRGSEPAPEPAPQPRSSPVVPIARPVPAVSLPEISAPITTNELRGVLSGPKMTPEEARHARELARQAFKSDQKGE